MPQQKSKYPTGFEPDTKPEGFEPDVLQPATKGFMSTISDFIPQPVQDIWSFATKPLTDVPSRIGSSVAETIDPSNTAVADRGFFGPFIAGATEGIGNVISGLTSPLNLATLGAFKGAGTLSESAPTVARGLGLISKGLSAPVAATGATKVLDPELSLPERAFGVAELAGGIAGTRVKVPKPKARPPVIPEVIPEATTPTISQIDPSFFDRITPEPTKPGAFDPSTLNLAKRLETATQPIPGTPKFEGTQTYEGGYKGGRQRGLRRLASEIVEPQTIQQPIISRLLTKQELDPNIPVRERVIQPGETISKLREVVSAPKGLMSVDLPFMTSAAFRQASPLQFTSEWFKAWGTAARTYGSQSAFDSVQSKIQNHKYATPRYKPVYDAKGNIKAYKETPSYLETIGIRMSDMKQLTTREEQIASRLAEKLPWVKASNRSYIAFLNDLRINKLESLVEAFKESGRNPETDLVLGKQLANFINDATGRGKISIRLGKNRELDFENQAKILNDVLWSPRNLTSKIRFFNPNTYRSVDDPLIRKEYVKGLARTLTGWAALAGLAELAGAEVSKDPNSADFGKIKIGNTRIDPAGGSQQLLVAASRLTSGRFTSSSTGKQSEMGVGFKPRTRLSTAEEFMANKLSPVARFAYDLMNASESRPVSLTDRAVQMTLPMMTQDIIEAAEDDPALAALIAPLSSIGMGTQTYEPGSFGKPIFSDFMGQVLGVPQIKFGGRR